jgi:uncharacterized UPF0160 family protein
MPKPKIITHNAGFHTDDVFGVATLMIFLNGEAEIIRTRDPEIIKTGDYVLDTGEIYDESKNKFDHHQVGKAGKRENGIYYASFGLIWKKFGQELCGSKEVADFIDKKLVQPIDAIDNGQDVYKNLFKGVFPYDTSLLINSFSPTWKEDKGNKTYEAFIEAVSLAKRIIEREIKVAQDWMEGEKKIEEKYFTSDNKTIIVFDKSDRFSRVMVTLSLMKHEGVMYAVIYKEDNDLWQAIALNKYEGTSETRKPFPELWAGLRGEDLARVTGVSDAHFCHNNRYFVLAKSKESAIKLAKLSLES